ncbi:hypothetical protein DFH27DRAFT_71099 [Peziza echinospora]|nr:hypothetical protein DFH27DRAFT_71099 [Peziza echinospora]
MDARPSPLAGLASAYIAQHTERRNGRSRLHTTFLSTPLRPSSPPCCNLIQTHSHSSQLRIFTAPSRSFRLAAHVRAPQVGAAPPAHTPTGMPAESSPQPRPEPHTEVLVVPANLEPLPRPPATLSALTPAVLDNLVRTLPDGGHVAIPNVSYLSFLEWCAARDAAMEDGAAHDLISRRDLVDYIPGPTNTQVDQESGCVIVKCAPSLYHEAVGCYFQEIAQASILDALRRGVGGTGPRTTGIRCYCKADFSGFTPRRELIPR